MEGLPELEELRQLEKIQAPLVSFEELETIRYNGIDYPITAVTIGPKDKGLPVLGLFGGIHGLERIGTQVIIAFLHTLLHQLKWDKELQRSLVNQRIVTIPIINPAGMARKSRSNPSDVDLMRNAPVEARGKLVPLVSGHRISPLLPWYQGTEGVMEKEAQVLLDFVCREVFPSAAGITLDVHSGFGIHDQLWYPYAHSRELFPREKETIALKRLLDQTYPNHIYKFEPQSKNYITHGDLWDYLFELHREREDQSRSIFLPLTLELGSWNWLRKNPLQFFSKVGLFHPVKQHRHARIMRRHLLLLDFLHRAVRNHHAWS